MIKAYKLALMLATSLSLGTVGMTSDLKDEAKSDIRKRSFAEVNVDSETTRRDCIELNLSDDSKNSMSKRRKLGYRPTSQKTKDMLKEHEHPRLLAPRPGATLPKSVDYRKFCHIFDQGDLGSCTANSLSGGVFARQLMEHMKVTPKDEIVHAKGMINPLSRLFIYYNERSMENTINQDAGASIGDGFLSLIKVGAPLELDWSYDINKFTTKPDDKVYKLALHNEIQDDIRIAGISARSSDVVKKMKDALANESVLSIGIMLYDSFQSAEVASTGAAPIPNTKKENFIGGHAVLVVGYEDEQKCFILANSWGEGWGDKGFFTLPYDYFNPSKTGGKNLVDEIWAIHNVTPAEETVH